MKKIMKKFLQGYNKVFPKEKVINLKKCEDTKNIIDKIKENYNIEKIVKDNDSSYASKLFIIKINDKKYFLKYILKKIIIMKII